MNNIKRKKRIAAVVCACTLAVALVIGGTTLAWLTDTTQTVKNTFTTSDIDITLTETKGELKKDETGGVVTGSSFKMIPGYTLAKDPKVTVEAGSEACWLFVKVEESVDSNTTVRFDDYMTYAIDDEDKTPDIEFDSWTQGTGGEGGIPANVYYRKVSASDGDQDFPVLKENQVVVLDTVTKEMMAAAAGKEPTLTFTAYASQLMKNNTTEFTAIEAWGNVPGK